MSLGARDSRRASAVMNAILLPFLLILASGPPSGALAETTVRPASVRKAPPPLFWMKRYPSRGFGASWRVNIRVSGFKKAKKKVLGVMSEAGAELTAPLESMAGSDKYKFQQLTYVVSRKGAAEALKRLKDVGSMDARSQTESFPPELASELSVKLDRLKAERKAGAVILKRLSAVSALVDELIEYLESVRAAHKASRDRVLFNITIKE